MTLQEIFDKVVAHARAQKKKAMGPDLREGHDNEPICMYRSPDGLRCFAGVLIPDELYSPNMEGQRFGSTSFDGKVNFDGVIPSLQCEDTWMALGLILELQKVHDFWEPEHWERGLRERATQYHLVYTPVGAQL